MTGITPAAPEVEREGSTYNRERVLALSDGVFAIAITLLVLEIVPDLAETATGAELLRQLLEAWPKLVAYFLSFLVIGRFWDTHRAFFRVIRLADSRVVWANLSFLLWVTLIPAAAALLGSHWQEPAALSLYALNLLLATASVWGLWRYASRAGFLRREGLDAHTELNVSRYAAVSAAGYAAAIPTALLSLPLALALVFLTTALARTLSRRILAGPDLPDAPGPGRTPDSQ